MSTTTTDSDEGPRLHPMAEAVLDEIDGDDGQVTMAAGAEARLEAALAKLYGSDDLLGAVEMLVTMATHAEINLGAPDISGRIYGVADRLAEIFPPSHTACPL